MVKLFSIGISASLETNDAQAETANHHKTNPSKMNTKYPKSHLSVSQTNHSLLEVQSKHRPQNDSNKIERVELP
jgi:hypothetical protein